MIYVRHAKVASSTVLDYFGLCTDETKGTQGCRAAATRRHVLPLPPPPSSQQLNQKSALPHVLLGAAPATPLAGCLHNWEIDVSTVQTSPAVKARPTFKQLSKLSKDEVGAGAVASASGCRL